MPRTARDAKYGFGGKKKYSKSNTAESTNDFGSGPTRGARVQAKDLRQGRFQTKAKIRRRKETRQSPSCRSLSLPQDCFYPLLHPFPIVSINPSSIPPSFQLQSCSHPHILLDTCTRASKMQKLNEGLSKEYRCVRKCANQKPKPEQGVEKREKGMPDEKGIVVSGS